jgi:hypothetical protein
VLWVHADVHVACTLPGTRHAHQMALHTTFVPVHDTQPSPPCTHACVAPDTARERVVDGRWPMWEFIFTLPPLRAVVRSDTSRPVNLAQARPCSHDVLMGSRALLHCCITALHRDGCFCASRAELWRARPRRCARRHLQLGISRLAAMVPIRDVVKANGLGEPIEGVARRVQTSISASLTMPCASRRALRAVC